MEDYLKARFPDAARLVTPCDDPMCETATNQAFLAALGYAPVAQAAYGKAR